MRALLASLTASVLLLAGCGADDSPVATGGNPSSTTTSTEVALAELTQVHGCGFGFQAGRPDQRIGIFLGRDGAVPANGVVALPAEGWDVTVEFGEDLFANWCDDVIGPDEPTSRMDETWTVVEGTLDVRTPDPADPGTAVVVATGLVAERPDGERVTLGDITVENPQYGTFAG